MPESAPTAVGAPLSPFNTSGSLREKIDAARLELLDLSTRNRLLHTPRSGHAKIVEICDELAEAMYQTLVVDEKRFTFLAAREDPSRPAIVGNNGEGDLEQPSAEPAPPDRTEPALDAKGRIASHWDTRLQTRMTSAGLQKRLLDLYIDSRTLEEEQGVNVLFLAVGFLKWRAPKTPNEERFAPLILIPVRLERSSANEKFHLKWSHEEVQTNLSLQLNLQREFAMRLPDIGEFESLDVDAYFKRVEAMIRNQPDWAVAPDDAVLGLFSFAKFMMYRDLGADQWQEFGGFEARASLRGLVSDGFPDTVLTDGEANIDALISPAQLRHVVDCDSSQSLVIYDVQKGTSLTVQGPPGTGKSQTIANVIAAGVADQKRILFVAEKMAALEVVKRRLDSAGIGEACLELHSNKANKRAVLESLQRTWSLGRRQPQNEQTILQQLSTTREHLNAHAVRLHRVLDPTTLTPYEVLGHLVRLRREGLTTQQLGLEGPTRWTPADLQDREDLLRDLVARIDSMGLPSQHAWAGVGIEGLTPNERDRVLLQVSATADDLDTWRERAGQLHAALDLKDPEQFESVGDAIGRAEVLAAAPTMGSDALRAGVWDTPEEVEALLEELSATQALRSEALTIAEANALSEGWAQTQQALRELAPAFRFDAEIASIEAMLPLLERVLPDATRLAQALTEQQPLTLDSLAQLVAIGERAGSIPAIEREALVACIWDRGVDTVEELIESVEKVQGAKRALAEVFRAAAWDMQFDDSRGQLAALGGSWWRIFSRQWRDANRQVRAQLVNPKLPADEVLRKLDELAAAQAAQRTIGARDGQGGEAFGGAWQRERSDARALREVATWMRSLRPLGAGVRERLADIADRSLASALASRIRPLVEDLNARLGPVSEALIAADRRPWVEETIARRVPLSIIKERMATWTSAARQCQHLRDRASLEVQGAAEHIERIVRAQAAIEEFTLSHDVGQAAFGALWRNLDSEVGVLQSATAWMHRHGSLRSLAARIDHPERFREEGLGLQRSASELVDRIGLLLATVRYEGSEGVDRNPRKAALAALATLFERWKANPEGLNQWVNYSARARQASDQGMAELMSRLASGTIAVRAAVGAFQLAFYEAVLAAMTKRDPALAHFDGEQHTQTVARFVEADQQRMGLARQQVALAHHQKIPIRGGAAGPTAILSGEMVRKRGHMPIRQLMGRCAPVIQALKPVLMMSPLSVAQFLPPGALEFDMLVIDEASQVQPVDALGAIARAKQLVIVGDERQLPPTRFFAKALGDDGEDDEKDDNATAVADVESVLGLCRARGLPERMLRWHYRSRHQSLIAVSNSQFYENKLFIVPSPYTSEAGVGLRFHHLPQAIYERGKTSTNPEEAKVVAQAVIDHARLCPELSLGVAAFSAQQRRAIIDELEHLRREHADTEAFFAAHPNEPFFAKSLENVQGDERDVIFISVGYGRDLHGHLTMNFGPLTREGGERRLNVLISRAKSRCEVFSSITDEDIDLDRARGKGPAAFKLFLHYARTGQLGISGAERSRSRRVFEDEVATALIGRGYDLHTDVGVAGLFVDIAVADAQRPGRYVLGIECDGEWYRDSHSARDRDRLRTQVLKDKGWNLHRIWVGDWFQQPQSELAKVEAAIARALAQRESEDDESRRGRRAVPVDIYSVPQGEFVEVGLTEVPQTPELPEEIPFPEPSGAQPYKEADFEVPRHQYELHQVPPDMMAEIVHRVVEIESPVHQAEVVVRVRNLWGVQRAGNRIQGAVEDGIARAIGRRRIARSRNGFLSIAGQPVVVRDRGAVASQTLRKPEHLPPPEIDAAILAIVQRNFGATMAELVAQTSRQLGYRATSAQLATLIEGRVRKLLASGALRSRNEMITVPKPGEGAA